MSVQRKGVQHRNINVLTIHTMKRETSRTEGLNAP